MIKKIIQNKIIASLFIAAFFLPAMSACAASGIDSDREVKHTAKITFFKNRSGELMAEIIPVNAEGTSPRSGWTICEEMSSEIRRAYAGRIQHVKRIRGYFLVTYRIIEKDKDSLFLMYKGELLKLEPWKPTFAKSI